MCIRDRVVVALIAWAGYSFYQNHKPTVVNTYSVDSTALDDYMSEMNAETETENGTEAAESEAESETEAASEEATETAAETEKMCIRDRIRREIFQKFQGMGAVGSGGDIRWKRKRQIFLDHHANAVQNNSLIIYDQNFLVHLSY